MTGVFLSLLRDHIGRHLRREEDNTRLVDSLLKLQAEGKPLYGSYRGRKSIRD